jgi:hypothetical protein
VSRQRLHRSRAGPPSSAQLSCPAVERGRHSSPFSAPRAACCAGVRGSWPARRQHPRRPGPRRAAGTGAPQEHSRLGCGWPMADALPGKLLLLQQQLWPCCCSSSNGAGDAAAAMALVVSMVIAGLFSMLVSYRDSAGRRLLPRFSR